MVRGTIKVAGGIVDLYKVLDQISELDELFLRLLSFIREDVNVLDLGLLLLIE